MKKSLTIATPIGDKPCAQYMLSLLRTWDFLRENGVTVRYLYRYGQSDLAYARNILASDFLASDYSDMLWIDADMAWEPESVLRFLNYDEDVVVGTYFSRDPGKHVPHKYLEGGAVFRKGSSLAEIESAGLGFAKVSRRAYEAIMQAQPELLRSPDHLNAKLQPFPLWRFFEFNGSGDGEDWTFYHRWHATGGKVYMDPHGKLGHYGEFNYEWDPQADFLLEPLPEAAE